MTSFFKITGAPKPCAMTEYKGQAYGVEEFGAMGLRVERVENVPPKPDTAIPFSLADDDGIIYFQGFASDWLAAEGAWEWGFQFGAVHFIASSTPGAAPVSQFS